MPLSGTASKSKINVYVAVLYRNEVFHKNKGKLWINCRDVDEAMNMSLRRVIDGGYDGQVTLVGWTPTSKKATYRTYLVRH